METLIEKYNTLQKQIVSELTEEQKVEEGSSTSALKTFVKEIHWNMLHHSIYVIEVGELAKKNFLKFGPEGTSGLPEMGRRYLRLFGLLSAVYQQKLAIENLLEIYEIEEKEKISSGLNSSEIINLCNQLGAHATHFRSNPSVSEHPYKKYDLSRAALEAKNTRQLIKKYEFESFDLLDDLIYFDKKAELTLSYMLAELLKKAYKNQGELYELYVTLQKEGDARSTKN
ncbi:hypothetical protein ACFSC6_13770 [Rufibacter sediminis]|uniref:DinB family protein n=1 Tax=Rufibacter sediminis TaxID=2762756 RepID=A0ABR6VYM5_9BACT|nr:hypothetical protein [Rufibacter sediminis]MBC3542261.1 hypothetical protein [Rufibacter sediminis]